MDGGDICTKDYMSVPQTYGQHPQAYSTQHLIPSSNGEYGMPENLHFDRPYQSFQGNMPDIPNHVNSLVWLQVVWKP
uniref:Uncharacterized protein n=1 Tax=Ditylenchus dipsaci TaxID=166011 RepID=A0A915DYM4_9BILA